VSTISLFLTRLYLPTELKKWRSLYLLGKFTLLRLVLYRMIGMIDDVAVANVYRKVTIS
jgi:hypothetical protein